MEPFATVENVIKLFRPLTPEEVERTEHLLPIVSDMLRQEALNAGKNLDTMIDEEEVLPSIAQSVVVDVIARTLMTSTSSEPMVQVSQAGLGYSMSGTYLNPGGGIFIKKSELSRLGLRRQSMWGVELC